MNARRRLIASRTLAGLAVLALLVAAIAEYAERTLFDSDRFATRAVSVLDDEAVKTQLAGAIADGAIASQPDLIAARPVLEGVSEFVVSLPALQSVLRAGAADLHRTVIEGDEDTLLLTLADVGTILNGALQTVAPEIARQIDAELDITIVDDQDVEGEGIFIDLSQIGSDLKALELIGLLVGLAAAAGSVALARTRLAGLRRLGRALVIGAFAAVASWYVGRGLLVAQFDGSAADTAEAIYNAFLIDLRNWFLVLAGGGVVVTAGATATREPIDLGASIARGWAWFTATTDRPPIRIARAIALIAAGIVIATNREWVIDLAVFAIGAYIVYVGSAELMRMAAGAVREAEAEDPELAGDDVGLGGLVRIATVGLLLFGVIVLAGVLTDEDEEPPLRLGTCNGSPDLCDRRLDQVAFAGTHNSMSGATYKNWFFAQHEAGITEQLEAGYRALLIDPHYGVRTSGGVATDLERDQTSGPKVAGSLGPEGVEAAERVRRRIGFDGGGDPEVFLCHAFCEVGAIDAVDGFREIRDFLVDNPEEVVVISIEDATTPEDTVAAIRRSGLDELAYRGPNGPWPTLRTLIDTNQRALIMAERDGGEPRWYRDQFAITKETPFSFDRPEQLEERASCKPNRGPANAPFFLLNHWVDTSPAPRPTNARVVNQEEFLLDRIELCERVRGMAPNIIAVDFFEEGDTLAVVDELNGVDRPG